MIKSPFAIGVLEQEIEDKDTDKNRINLRPSPVHRVWSSLPTAKIAFCLTLLLPGTAGSAPITDPSLHEQVTQALADIIQLYAADCPVLTFSDSDISPLAQVLNWNRISSVQFHTLTAADGIMSAESAENKHHAEVLRLPCLVNVLWGNVSSFLELFLSSLKEWKTTSISREYFLLYDSGKTDREALMEAFQDRPNVAVLSPSPTAAEATPDLATGHVSREAPVNMGQDRQPLKFGVLESTITAITSNRLTLNAWKAARNASVRIHVRCLYCRRGLPQVYLAGSWSPQLRLQLISQLFYDQFANFHGHRLTCLILKFVPFVDFMEREEGTLRVLPSTDIFSVDATARKLNFSYTMQSPPDCQWGVKNKDGQWTGMIGELAAENGDFALVVTRNYARNGVVRFTRIYAIDSFVFVTRLAQPLPQWLSIFRPFKTSVWLTTISAVAVSGGLAYLFVRLHPLPEPCITLQLSILNSCAAMCKLPQTPLPRCSLAAQLFLGWWWFFCIIILTAYQSSLVAVMTVPSVTDNINTLEQLVASDYEWGISDIGASDQTLFETSPLALFQRMFRTMHFLSADKSFAKLLLQPYAFISWKSNIQAKIAEQYTDYNGQPLVHMSKQTFSPENIAWAFRPSAPFVHKFDAVLQRLTEAGMIRKWEQDTIERRAALGRNKRRASGAAAGNKFLSLSLYHMQGAFIVLATGIGAGTLALIGELAMAHKLPLRVLHTQ